VRLHFPCKRAHVTAPFSPCVMSSESVCRSCVAGCAQRPAKANNMDKSQPMRCFGICRMKMACGEEPSFFARTKGTTARQLASVDAPAPSGARWCKWPHRSVLHTACATQ